MVIDDGAVVRFEIRNGRPVDLLDLTAALGAFGEAYRDYAVTAGFESTESNLRFFVKEIKSGSIITDLGTYAEQASLLLKHAEVAAAFLSHFNELVQVFLGTRTRKRDTISPTRREAEQVYTVMEPVAKDNASQLFLQVHGDYHAPATHVHFHYESQQANAVQNGARRFLGARLPVIEVRHDVLLRLQQVRGDASSKVGDRGVIEEVTTAPVKLIFSSEENKRKVLDEPFPFDTIFVVDVEIKSVEGRPAIYRILAVKDTIPLPRPE